MKDTLVYSSIETFNFMSLQPIPLQNRPKLLHVESIGVDRVSARVARHLSFQFLWAHVKPKTDGDTDILAFSHTTVARRTPRRQQRGGGRADAGTRHRPEALTSDRRPHMAHPIPSCIVATSTRLQLQRP